MYSRNLKKEKTDEMLNTSNYNLFDCEDEEDNKIENSCNPKTVIISKNSKNKLLNSFELLGENTPRKDNSGKRDFINKDKNIIFSVQEKINNDISNNIMNNIKKENNSDYNINKIDDDDINSNFNINQFMNNNDNNNNIYIKNDIKNIDNNDDNINNNKFNGKDKDIINQDNNHIRNNNIRNNFHNNNGDKKLNNIIIDNNNVNIHNDIINNDNNKNDNINNNINKNYINNINNNNKYNIDYNKLNNNYINNNGGFNNNNKINFNNINYNNINNNKILINNFNNKMDYENKDDFNINNKIKNNSNNIEFNNGKKGLNNSCLIGNNININNYNSHNNNNNININNNNINKSYNIKIHQTKEINKYLNKNINSIQEKKRPIKVNDSNNLNKKIGGDRIDVNKMRENLISKKLIMNNKTSIIKKNQNKSPFRIKETEEQRKIREQKEKEQKEIRDKLQCYLCFGKAIKARYCLNCKKIACDKCVREMLEKYGKCLSCKKESTLEDIISLPFMEDITAFFIKNVENYQNQRNINLINNEDEDEDMKDEQNININENAMDEDLIEQNDNIPNCEEHIDKKIEYYCIECNEYFCSKCLIFTNQETVEKHKNHKIIGIEELKRYNINEAINEYKKLKSSTKNFDKMIDKCKDKIKNLELQKKKINDILELVKTDNEKKFDQEIKKLNDLVDTITNQKENIENSINSVPNSFNNIIYRHDYGQGQLILEELKKVNRNIISEDEVIRQIGVKSNLFWEFHQSETITFVIPDNEYIEEYIVFDSQINFIPETVCKLKAQFLGGSFVFILSIEINEEYYHNHQPKFYTYFSFKNPENKYFYTVFSGDVYSNGIQILTTELGFEQIKEMIIDNNFIVRLNMVKTYYK